MRFASFIYYLMGSGLLFGIFSQVGVEHLRPHDSCPARLVHRRRTTPAHTQIHTPISPPYPPSQIHIQPNQHQPTNKQVNHFSARCVDAATKPTSWAVRQIETAANFCVDSWYWSLGAWVATCPYMVLRGQG